MDRVGLTSYSDYMRCLAAKYNNNPPGGPGGAGPANTIKADILPLLAAHGSAFPAAAFSLPGLGLFNPFLASQASQASDSKPGPPVLPPTSTSSSSSSSPPPSERLKRPKEDPLDLTDKKLKREKREERAQSREERRSASPGSRPLTPKNLSMAEWSVEEVADFVSKVDDCQEYAKVRSLPPM